MPLIVPNASDTTSGNKYEALDQAEPDALDFEILSVSGSGVLLGCAVTTNSSASNVAVEAGVVLLKGLPYVVAANSALGLPASPADSRFDLVVARVTAGVAALAVVSGSNSSTNPSFPKSASVLTGAPSLSTNVNFDTDVVLAALYRSGASTITSSRITDKRVMQFSSIKDQGTDAPLTARGDGPGNLYYRNAAINGVGTGVYIKGNDGTWVELAQNVGSHLPIGAAVLWPSKEAVPYGCVEANGQSLSTTAYPALFAAYAYTHGGSGGSFLVPNYNGKFIRGTTTTSLVGTTVGSDTATISTANMPVHSHAYDHTHTLSHTHGIDHNHASVTTSSDGSHSHSYNYLAGRGYSSWTAAVAYAYESFTATDVSTGGTTGSTGTAHTHTVDLPNHVGSTTSQSTTTTSSGSTLNTSDAGGGTPLTIIPAAAYSRWIVRATLGSDPTYTGGSPGGVPLVEFSHDLQLASPTVTTKYMWVASFPCVINTVRGYRVGGSTLTFNVKWGTGQEAMSADLSLVASATWYSSAATLNTAVAEGDVVEVEIVTAAGSPTNLIVQVDFTAA